MHINAFQNAYNLFVMFRTEEEHTWFCDIAFLRPSDTY